MASLPTQAMKSYYGIETCAFRVATTTIVTYVRVTYLAVTSTVTESKTDTSWQPMFPTTNALESKADPEYDEAQSIRTTPFSTSTWRPSNISLVTTGIEVVRGNPAPVLWSPFDAADFVQDNHLDVTPNISSYCSSYYANEYTRLGWAARFDPEATTKPAYLSAWSRTFVPPCCGSCMINPPNVKVHYWPTPAVSGLPSTVNDAGFTLYVDPSSRDNSCRS